MSNAVVTKEAGELMEAVLIKGDLSKLTAEERGRYYTEVCKSVGLNPLTKPFEYITLNGRLTLYALRTCTDQLRAIHKVSVVEATEAERDGVYIVTCKVQNAAGRTDVSKGAVNLGGLKGEALANAIMKAETKAKRRATLSICGLGMLDETEVEDIPATRRENPHTTKPADVTEVPVEDSPYRFHRIEGITPLPKKDAKPISTKLQDEMRTFVEAAELWMWGDSQATRKRMALMPDDWREILSGIFMETHLSLVAAEAKAREESEAA